MPTGVRILLSWVLGIDAAVLGALGCYLSYAYYVASNHHGILPAHIVRRPWQTGALKLSHAILLLLVVMVAIWDMAHPGQQFPVSIRLAFTIPSLALTNYALLGLVRNASEQINRYHHFRGRLQ